MLERFKRYILIWGVIFALLSLVVLIYPKKITLENNAQYPIVITLQTKTPRSFQDRQVFLEKGESKIIKEWAFFVVVKSYQYKKNEVVYTFSNIGSPLFGFWPWNTSAVVTFFDDGNVICE